MKSIVLWATRGLLPLLLTAGTLPAAAVGFPPGDLRVAGEAGWVSRYLYRGEARADSSLQVAGEALWRQDRASFYAGAWSNTATATASDHGNEVDLYGGATWILSPFLAVDTGYTQYFYTAGGARPADAAEPYAGLLLELPLRPAVYGYYNFAYQQWLGELRVDRRWYPRERWTLRAAAQVGLGYAADASSGSVRGAPGERFGYLGLELAGIYALTDQLDLRLHGEWAGRRTGSTASAVAWGLSVRARY